MTGRIIVITGAGSGIGAATARHFSAKGDLVIVVDINVSAAEHTVESCAPGLTFAEACDVSDANAFNDLAKRIHSEHGQVDVLVNNAGVGAGGPFLDQGPDDWSWLRGVNIDGVVNGCRSFGPDMIKRGHGHVVNVASGAAWVPSRRTATYCASKAAVLMFSRSLRADWRLHDVGVTVVCPGVINTPIFGSTRTVGLSDKETSRIEWAFRHSHPPEAVAKAIDSAVRRNRAVVPVGIEAHLARLTPPSIIDMLARL